MKKYFTLLVPLLLLSFSIADAGVKRLDKPADTYITANLADTGRVSGTSATYPITDEGRNQKYDGLIAWYYIGNMVAVSSVDSLAKADTAIITTIAKGGYWADTLSTDTVTLPGYVKVEYYENYEDGTVTIYGDSTAAVVTGDGKRPGLMYDLLYFNYYLADSAVGTNDTVTWRIDYKFKLYEDWE